MVIIGEIVPGEGEPKTVLENEICNLKMTIPNSGKLWGTMGGPERWGDLSIARASDSIAVFWVAGIHGVKDRGFWAEVSDVTVLSGAGGDCRARSRSVQRHVDRLREEGSDAGPSGLPQMASTARSRAVGGWGLVLEHMGPLAWAPSHSRARGVCSPWGPDPTSPPRGCPLTSGGAARVFPVGAFPTAEPQHQCLGC